MKYMTYEEMRQELKMKYEDMWRLDNERSETWESESDIICHCEHCERGSGPEQGQPRVRPGRLIEVGCE